MAAAAILDFETIVRLYRFLYINKVNIAGSKSINVIWHYRSAKDTHQTNAIDGKIRIL